MGCIKGIPVEDLLSFVIDAHGGLARWNLFSDFVTDVDVRGKICSPGRWGALVPRSRLLFSLRNQRTIIFLPDGEGHWIVEPFRISQFDSHQIERASLAHPGLALMREPSISKWDSFRTAYFMANVIRHAAIGPFLYTLPGFRTEELAPWNEQGQTWRVLKVEFPPDQEVPFHSRLAYFGADGLLRRIQSKPDVLGGLDLIEEVTSYARVDGLQVPVSREVFTCDSNGRRNEGESLGRIQLRNFFFAC